MSRFRIIYQREQEDCGAACLAMILRFYGFQVTLETIKAFCGNMKNGITMYGLNRSAEQMGFNTHAVRLNKKELISLRGTTSPFIAYWKQSHFIVVYKITTHHVYIADPAIGRVRYRLSDFQKGFSLSDENDGFVLLLEPRKIDIRELYNNKPTPIKLNGFVKSHCKQLILVAISLLALSGIGFIFPFLTQAIVDKGIAEKNPNILVVILCATLALAVGRTLFSFLKSRMALVAGTLIDIDLANYLLSRLSALPMKFFDARKVGDMIQRVSDVSRIGDYFSSCIADSVLSFVMFCVYGGILLYLYPLLFGVFMIGATIYVMFILLFLQRRKVLDYEFFSAASKSQEELIQYLRGMVELKLACAEKERLGIWKKHRIELFDVSRKSLMLSQKQELGSVFIFQVVDAIIIYLMAKAVIDGHTTLGSMMAVQYIIGSMENPLHIVTGFIQETQSMCIALSRVSHITSVEPEKTGALKIDESCTSLSITVSDVSFSYDRDLPHPALQNVSAYIPSGKTTALVGMSGSGKTTLLKLLLGFYAPNEGAIYVNDNHLSKLDLIVWRKNIGAVMQDGYIFSDTIINNVALGDASPSIVRIKKSLEIACADFVFSLPVGLRTIIGAEGMTLSTGQRQRILIARAIYKQPALFLLDEATNALDAINERRIYENLHTELSGKTVVIAAHRLSTIRNADQILVFDDGHIVECGTHDELLKNKGKYSELVQNQRYN